MLLVQLRIFLCMYLPQAVPLPPSFGIESDLFLYGHPLEEVQLETAVVTCSIAEPLVLALSLQSGQLCRGRTGPFLSLIARDRLHLRSKMGLGCGNPAY